MGTLFERLVAWTLRSVAAAMQMAGMAMLVTAVPTWPVTADSSTIRAIVVILMQMGALLVVGSAATKYLLRGRAPVLPNERMTVAEQQRPALTGWLTLFALVLAAAPLAAVVWLQPFLAEWRFVWGFIADPELWDNANANMSGVILIPLFGALTPPFLQLLTLVGFAGASAMLVPLLVTRSPRFPRLYIASVVLLAAMLLASVRATSGAMLAGVAMREDMARIARASTVAAEDTSLRDALDRYSNAVRTAAPPLAWTWFAYAIWIPVLFSSERIRLTLANRIEQITSSPITLPPRPPDVASITQPPRFPGL